MALKKKNELSNREFTDEISVELAKTDTTKKPEVELQPFVMHTIEYQVNGLDPVIDSIDLEFRPSPSNTDIIDSIIKKLPHLLYKRHSITILKANQIKYDKRRDYKDFS